MFIVIETFDKSFPSIVCDKDGYPKIYESEKKAQKEADKCQLGIVVEI